MSVHIRAARPDHAPALIGAYEWLFSAPGSVPPGWDPDRAVVALGELIASDVAAVLVATDGEQLVGLCTPTST